MQFSKCKCFKEDALVSFLIQIGDTSPFAHSDLEHVKEILSKTFSSGESRISGFLIKGKNSNFVSLTEEEKEEFKNILLSLGYEEFFVQNYNVSDELVVGESESKFVSGSLFFKKSWKGVLFESL